MNKKLPELKEYILIYERDKNPFYDINPDIKISETSQWYGPGIDSNNVNVKYKVEYISKLDSKWRKWYSKDEPFSDIIQYLREIRLNKILDNPDN